jgi:hypothetical protein
LRIAKKTLVLAFSVFFLIFSSGRCKQVLQGNSKNGRALAQLGKVYYDTGRYQQAVITLLQGVECGRAGPEVWRLLARAR